MMFDIIIPLGWKLTALSKIPQSLCGLTAFFVKSRVIMLAGRIRCDPFGQRPRDHKHHKIADMDEPRSATWIAALPIDPPRGLRDGFASAQERARRTLQAPCRAEDSRLVRWLCDALLRGQFQPPG